MWHFIQNKMPTLNYLNMKWYETTHTLHHGINGKKVKSYYSIIKFCDAQRKKTSLLTPGN